MFMADLPVLVVESKIYTRRVEKIGLLQNCLEHAKIVRCLGIKKLIVAVNKMDLVMLTPSLLNFTLKRR